MLLRDVNLAMKNLNPKKPNEKSLKINELAEKMLNEISTKEDGDRRFVNTIFTAVFTENELKSGEKSAKQILSSIRSDWRHSEIKGKFKKNLIRLSKHL